MDEKKLAKLEQLLSIANQDFVTPEMLMQVLDILSGAIGKGHKELAGEIETLKENIASLEEEDGFLSDSFRTSIVELRDKVLASIKVSSDSLTKEIARVEKLIPEAVDTENIILEASKRAESRLKPFIPTMDTLATELPRLGEPIRNALEILNGEDRLDKSAIKGIEEMEKEFKGIIQKSLSIMPSVHGGSRGVQLYVDGTLVGEGQYLNFIPGTGITISYALSGGRNDITISASSSGSGFTKLTATGTIDGNNAAFTFTSKPTYIISDGAWYTENNGWTYSGSTATMSIPPNSDIYGFV